MELNLFLEATLIVNFVYLERFAQFSMTVINLILRKLAASRITKTDLTCLFVHLLTDRLPTARAEFDLILSPNGQIKDEQHQINLPNHIQTKHFNKRGKQ
jgi:hypothetical protein